MALFAGLKVWLGYVHCVSLARMQELGRALHMALFVWQPGALLTSKCDKDVESFCLNPRPNMAKTPGAIGTCLANVVGGQDF